MLTIKIQCLLLFMLCTITFSVLYLIFQNYDKNTSITPRHFRDDMYTRELEINTIVFIATFISNLRDFQLFLIKKFLGKSVTPFVLSIMRVMIKMISICLFDYRIIHVNSTSYIVRFNILLADLTSFLFNEAKDFC